MDAIYSLVKCLSKSEFETVRNNYSSQLSENREVEKTLSMLDFLRKSEEEPGKIECMMHVYGRIEDSSFRQLKSRLTHRILDSVIAESNLDKIDHLEQLEIMSIKLRKRLSQVTYLYFTKGNLPVVYELLNSTAKAAEDYNIYSVLIDSLKFKKQMAYIRGSDVEINEADQKIIYYEKCDKARNKAADYYYQLIRKVNTKASVSSQNIQELLINAINELKTLYEDLKAPAVGYYLKSLEMAYFENNGDLNLAKESCLEQIEIVKSKELYRKERVGMVYDNVGHFELQLGNYDSAISYFKIAQSNFKELGINKVLSKEQEFLACFYDNRLEQASELIEEILNYNREDLGKFREAKFKYYKAALRFKEKDYAGCYNIVSRNLEISADKGGWDIAIRCLMIMCSIEQEEYDLTTLHIQSLKKHLERTKKKEDISERDQIIFKILVALEKQGYQWNLIGPGNLNGLAELCEKKGKLSWKPLSAELIQFDEWVKSKVGERRMTKWKEEVVKETRRAVVAK